MVGGARRGGVTAHGENFHTHRTHAFGDFMADVPIADYAKGLACTKCHVEFFPAASHLVADHAAKILGEIENSAEYKLAEGRTEDADTVGQGNVAFDQLGEECLFDTHVSRMHPAEIAAVGEDFAEKNKGTGPVEKDLGFRSGLR